MKIEYKDFKLEDGKLVVDCTITVEPNFSSVQKVESEWEQDKQRLANAVEYKLRDLWIEKHGDKPLDAINAEEIVKSVAQDLIKKLMKDRF